MDLQTANNATASHELATLKSQMSDLTNLEEIIAREPLKMDNNAPPPSAVTAEELVPVLLEDRLKIPPPVLTLDISKVSADGMAFFYFFWLRSGFSGSS
jgi:hypothetical protein